MAKCFDVVGYVEPCNAVRQKYTGRALLIVANGLPITLDTNGIILTQLLSNTSFQEFYNATQEINTIKSLPISINAQNPFGVTVQGNIDSGRVMYTKTIPVSLPATSDGKAEEFIMGLQNGLITPSVVVLENVESGKVFAGPPDQCRNDIFGAYSSVRLDPASVTRNEYENGGAWNFNLVCEEPVPNVICTLTDLPQVLDTLNA